MLPCPPAAGSRDVLLPFLFLLYIIAFLDRVNVAYVALEQGKRAPSHQSPMSFHQAIPTVS